MSTDISILRTPFEKRADGRWGISALVPMRICKSADSDRNPVRVENQLVHAQGMSLPQSSQGMLAQSVVPIVANVRGESVVRCVGTGFIISCSGLLITAGHVVSDAVERGFGVSRRTENNWLSDGLNFGALIPVDSLSHATGYVFYPFEWCTFLAEERIDPLPIKGIDLRLTSDIAICKIQERSGSIPHQPLAIVQKGIQGLGMSLGSAIFALGYAELRDFELWKLPSGQILGAPELIISVTSGLIEEQFPDNFSSRQVPTPGPCFSFSAKVPAGMSGSPIFDREGVYVHGVISRGWEDENGLSPYSFGSMIAPSLNLPIPTLHEKTLLDLLGQQDSGMPKLGGGGI